MKPSVLTKPPFVTIRAGVLKPGDRIVLRVNDKGFPTKTLKVNTVEPGNTCGGIHVNVVRFPATAETVIGGEVKIVPSPMRDAILSSDGCYKRCAFLPVIPASDETLD